MRDNRISNYQELAEKGTPEWPYPVNYGKESEVSADVIIIGGGIAGCHAAIKTDYGTMSRSKF